MRLVADSGYEEAIKIASHVRTCTHYVQYYVTHYVRNYVLYYVRTFLTS